MLTSPKSIFTFAQVVFAGAVFAAPVIFDYSPDAWLGTVDSNCQNSVCAAVNEAYGSIGQNWAESVTFTSSVALTGMATYSKQSNGNGHVGDSVTIRIRDDSGGIPGALLYDFTSVISGLDSDGSSLNSAFAQVTRKYASFSPITLNANTTYWIGMMGTTVDIGQQFLDGPTAPDDAHTWMFQGGFGGYNLFGRQAVGDMAFRLYGDPASIPVPSTLAVAVAALLSLRFATRARRAHSAA